MSCLLLLILSTVTFVMDAVDLERSKSVIVSLGERNRNRVVTFGCTASDIKEVKVFCAAV